MNAKVLRVLEYDKVIHMLEQKATSDPGRQLCRDLVPMTDLAQIEQAQTETADALTRIFQKGSLNFGSNKPLGMCLRSLEIGSTLSSEELLRIAGLLENTARVKNFGRSDKDEEQQDSLTEYFHCLEPLAPLSKEIRRCIIDVDEIADDASPALKKIRRSMVLTGEKIHNQLNSMVNGSVRNYLQDAVITTRDGRYCIPVKAEYKGQVPGMVHDQSSTGSTFFIEPAAVVSLNNQLRELEIEEQKEIAVILANLSAEAGAHTLEIAENQRIMTQLDFLHLSEEMHAVFASNRAPAHSMHADFAAALARMPLSPVNNLMLMLRVHISQQLFRRSARRILFSCVMHLAHRHRVLREPVHDAG